jgi:hypothetical protein
VCVLTNKKNVKRERPREHERSKREKADEKQQTERELPEKKRSKKNETKIGGVWCSSVVLIIILRITTTIKASESCNSSRALSKEAKERSTGKRELFRTE